MGYRTILVGTDGSATAARAVDRGAALAGRVGGRLILVCASAPIGLHDRRAKAVLREAWDRARAGGVEAETIFREGRPDDVILALAREHDADLIVVGNVGMGKARRLGLRPVPERVAGEAPCDVLIAFTRRDGAEGTRPWGRILAGTDGSATASEAARKAFDLAMTLGIGVTLVYVAGDPLVGAIVLERTAKTKPRALGVASRLRTGDPADEIGLLAEEEGIGLIVVGNRGMTGARRILLGSVPSRVVHGASTDVLVAKTVNRTVADLAPGTGGLVDVGGRKLAVYKAADGTLVALSPRCPHMGCTVDWNAAEDLWECPCHGSRYSTEGEIIRGPSERGLGREEIGDA
jgi:nucleotide-binding universal stress UspA family protein